MILKLFHEGKVYSWGMGSNNQLGSGDEEDVFVPTPVGGKQLQSKYVYVIFVSYNNF